MIPFRTRAGIVRTGLALLGFVPVVVSSAGCGQLEAFRGASMSPGLQRAEKLLKNKDRAGAVREFDKAIAADRNNIDVYMAIMSVCGDAGDIDLMAKYGEVANAATSKAPAEKRAIVLRRTGAAFLQLGSDPAKAAKAVEFLEPAYQLRPNDPAYMNDLGYAYAELYTADMPGALPKLQEALRLTKEAVARARAAGATDKELGVYLDSLGWVYHRLRGYKEAVTELARAADLAPDLKEIQVHLAEALFAGERPEDAVIAMRKARLIDPNDSQLAVRLQQMQAAATQKQNSPPPQTGVDDTAALRTSP